MKCIWMKLVIVIEKGHYFPLASFPAAFRIAEIPAFDSPKATHILASAAAWACTSDASSQMQITHFS